MERFSGDYIRQQPEYRYLVHRDTSQVIQTCVEDGEVKLRFGHQPGPPGDDVVRLPQRPGRPTSVNSVTSGSVSHSVVYHLTTAEPNQLNVASQSMHVRNEEFRRQRQAGGIAGQPENKANTDFHGQGQTEGTTELSTDIESKDTHEQKITTCTRTSRDAGNKDVGQENSRDIARHSTDLANENSRGQKQTKDIAGLSRDASNGASNREQKESEGTAGLSTNTQYRGVHRQRETWGDAGELMHTEKRGIRGQRNGDSCTSRRPTETVKHEDFHGQREGVRMSAGNFSHTYRQTNSIDVQRHAARSVPYSTVEDVSVTELSTDTRNDIDEVNDMRLMDEDTTNRATTREKERETGEERPVFQGEKKTKRSTVQQKQSGMSKSASKQQTSKGKLSFCGKKVNDKIQRHRKNKVLIAACLSRSSHNPPQQTRKVTPVKEDTDSVQQSGPEDSGAREHACHDFVHVPSPCKTDMSESGDTCNTRRNYEWGESLFLNAPGNKNRNDYELSRTDEHPTGYELPTQTISQTSLDRFIMNDKELNTQHFGTAKRGVGSFRGLIITEEADDGDRITEQAALQIDTVRSTANARVSCSQVHAARIDRPEEDRLLMAEDLGVDAASCSGFPRPVTRVDVIEAHSPRNTACVDTGHDRLREPEDTGSQEQGAKDTETPASFTIPVIVVDDVSAEADGSEYSEDVDAVSIDADEYLALSQCVQSGGNNEGFSSNTQGLQNSQNDVLNRLTSRVLRDYYKNSEPLLNVPEYPKLSQERMPSRWEDEPQERRAGSDYIRRYSVPAALQTAGPRRTLTPATYNVEFQSYTALRPYTSPVPSALHHASGESLLPPSETGSRRASLKSAMSSSRRSSMSGVGAVRWDLGLTDTSPLNRQVSWAGHAPSTSNVSRRRHSSVHGIHGEERVGTIHTPLDWRPRETPVPAEEPGTGQGQWSRKHSDTRSSDLQAVRRMSTTSTTSAGRNRRASRVDSVVGGEIDAHALLTRQASQVKRVFPILLNTTFLVLHCPCLSCERAIS